MDSKKRLKELIEKYMKYKETHKSSDLSEEETRGWINELLSVFGWDVLNIQQVQQEKIVEADQKMKLIEIESTHTKPDYTLVNGGLVKAYLDAKSTDVDIFTNKDAAFQVKSYGWSAGMPCSFLTNFEQFVIFDCRYTPEKGSSADVGAIQISIDDYIDEFDTLYNHLNRILVYNNNLSKLYDTVRLEGTHTVDESFNRLLSEFRLILANNIYKNNVDLLDNEELNYYVQIILDRIIFIRVCESKGIEKEGQLLKFAEKGFWNTFKNSCYTEFYNHYDGAMFSKDVNDKFPKIILEDSIFEEFVHKLYYPYPYRFNVIPIKVIAKIYEEFLAYVLVMKNNSVVVELKEDYVKTNGAVPTHEFIATAICQDTLAQSTINSPQDIFSLRILDPCCGSGVFLVAAYEYLAKKLMDIITENSQWCIVDEDKKYLTIAAKQKIMREVLYGIDCDPTAVEVTKMSLALKVVDDIEVEVFSEIGVFGDKILCDIHQNIVIGNTLVDTDIKCSPKELKYIRPLNIKKGVFKRVFEEKGGFDYCLGNPPYVETKYFKAASETIHNYLHMRYTTFEGKVDLAVLFIERTMELLNHCGSLGMIIQRRWFKTNYGSSARKFISSGSHLYKLLDIETNSLFKGRITYVSIMVLTKIPNKYVLYDLIKGETADVQAYFENQMSPNKIESSYFTADIWAPELKNVFDLKNRCALKNGTVGSNDKISVRDGIQALWKKVYDITDYTENNGIVIGKNGFGEEVHIEKEMVKPVVYNREFLPLKTIRPDAYRIFPYEGLDNKTKLSIKTIEKRYPLAYQYLQNNKKRITEKVKCNSGEYWATYTREHNHDSFHSAKIIIPMTTKETYASFVYDKGLYMDNSNVWFISYKGDNMIVMKALTMIINSTVFSVFAKCGANPASNGYYKFNKQFIEPVPLPNSKITPDNICILELAKLYDEMIEIMSEYEKAYKTDRDIYRGIMETKWEYVDKVCCELYELDDDEVNIVNSVGRIENRILGGGIN